MEHTQDCGDGRCTTLSLSEWTHNSVTILYEDFERIKMFE